MKPKYLNFKKQNNKQAKKKNPKPKTQTTTEGN